MRKAISLYTFGCKMNQYESQGMAEKLSKGFNVSFNNESADLFLINSCTVTAEADRKLRQLYRKLKSKNPDSLFVVVGCYSEVSPEELEKIGFDLVLGVKDKLRIETEIAKLYSEQITEIDKDYFIVSAGPESRTRAYIGIEDGCLNKCAYCKIRIARGSQIISKPIDIIYSEILGLLENNYKEIVLTGINIGYFGRDTNEDLFELFRKISKIDGDFRLRLSSIDPGLLDERLLDIIVNDRRFAQHFHLSLQSGSEKILKLMKRNYSIEKYKSIVEHVRKINPRFSFTTDIIVGFPGETQYDFDETLEFVKMTNFLKVHAFRFSPRKGTNAAVMENQVSNELKKERARELHRVAFDSAHVYLEKHLGKNSRVLVERKDGHLSYGYDEYYIPHIIDYEGLQNEFVDVYIREVMKARAWSDAELYCGSMVE